MPALKLLASGSDAELDIANGTIETIAAAAALSLTKEISRLTISGTMNVTLAAPTKQGQKKFVYTASAASTPVCALTVTDCEPAGSDVFSGFGTITDSAPKSLELKAVNVGTSEAPSLKWTIVSMVGVTVA